MFYVLCSMLTNLHYLALLRVFHGRSESNLFLWPLLGSCNNCHSLAVGWPPSKNPFSMHFTTPLPHWISINGRGQVKKKQPCSSNSGMGHTYFWFQMSVRKILANMSRVMSIFLYPTELSEKLTKRVAENWEPRGARNASNLWNRAHLSA